MFQSTVKIRADANQTDGSRAGRQRFPQLAAWDHWNQCRQCRNCLLDSHFTVLQIQCLIFFFFEITFLFICIKMYFECLCALKIMFFRVFLSKWFQTLFNSYFNMGTNHWNKSLIWLKMLIGLSKDSDSIWQKKKVFPKKELVYHCFEWRAFKHPFGARLPGWEKIISTVHALLSLVPAFGAENMVGGKKTGPYFNYMKRNWASSGENKMWGALRVKDELTT